MRSLGREYLLQSICTEHIRKAADINSKINYPRINTRTKNEPIEETKYLLFISINYLFHNFIKCSKMIRRILLKKSEHRIKHVYYSFVYFKIFYKSAFIYNSAKQACVAIPH